MHQAGLILLRHTGCVFIVLVSVGAVGTSAVGTGLGNGHGSDSAAVIMAVQIFVTR